eukprot:2388754-Rhodomonas_salina.1
MCAARQGMRCAANAPAARCEPRRRLQRFNRRPPALFAALNANAVDGHAACGVLLHVDAACVEERAQSPPLLTRSFAWTRRREKREADSSRATTAAGRDDARDADAMRGRGGGAAVRRGKQGQRCGAGAADGAERTQTDATPHRTETTRLLVLRWRV